MTVIKIGKFDPKDLPSPMEKRKPAKYPFFTIGINEYFDVQQLNGYPKLDTIKQLCYQYKRSRPDGATFRYAWQTEKDKNGDRIIRVYCYMPADNVPGLENEP